MNSKGNDLDRAVPCYSQPSQGLWEVVVRMGPDGEREPYPALLQATRRRAQPQGYRFILLLLISSVSSSSAL